MSSFVKSQQEMRANLTEQIRDVIESAEKEERGLVAEDIQKIDRIEAEIRQVEEAVAVAQRNEERSRQAEEAAASFVPASESRSEADVFRSDRKSVV